MPAGMEGNKVRAAGRSGGKKKRYRLFKALVPRDDADNFYVQRGTGRDGDLSKDPGKIADNVGRCCSSLTVLHTDPAILASLPERKLKDRYDTYRRDTLRIVKFLSKEERFRGVGEKAQARCQRQDHSGHRCGIYAGTAGQWLLIQFCRDGHWLLIQLSRDGH